MNWRCLNAQWNRTDPVVGISVFHFKTDEDRLSKYSGERQSVSLRVTEDSLLHLPAVLGERAYSSTASVEGQAEIHITSRDEFKAIHQRDLQLCKETRRILAAETHSVRTTLGEHLDQRQCAKNNKSAWTSLFSLSFRRGGPSCFLAKYFDGFLL